MAIDIKTFGYKKIIALLDDDFLGSLDIIEYGK